MLCDAAVAVYTLFRVMMVAKKFAAPGKRKMQFAVSNAENFTAELNDLGLSYVNQTPVVVARDLSERRYVMQQPLTYVVVAYVYVTVCLSAVFRIVKLTELSTFHVFFLFVSSRCLILDSAYPILEQVAFTILLASLHLGYIFYPNMHTGGRKVQ